MANRLVNELAKKLKPPAVGTSINANTARALAHASNVPEIVMFAGFHGDPIPGAGDAEWEVLYLDMELRTWLLIEQKGVVLQGTVKDDEVPFSGQRDVFWVRADATVGRGSRAQSVEAQFLTGEFTRAGDCETPAGGGGTYGGSTGVFCEARTPQCCYRLSRG